MVQVIDTPGLFDTAITEEELKTRIEECVKMSVPGPHAFLLVIRLGVRFTEEERNAVKWIQENFGDDASMYTIMLFTCKDQAKADNALKECKELRRLSITFGRRYHAFNNKDTDDQVQVTELVNMIKEMVQDNGGKHYTNEMYEKAQRKLREEEERKKQEEEEKKEEERKMWDAEREKQEKERVKEKNVKRKNIRVASAAAVLLVLAGVVIAVGANTTVALALGAPALVLGVLCGLAALISAFVSHVIIHYSNKSLDARREQVEDSVRLNVTVSYIFNRSTVHSYCPVFLFLNGLKECLHPST